ncbi:allantoate deiminase [Gottschalkiaceae bacterium SANA]|nr:allantoate deiminase [Gottschalkiaceae bacterium SANA]
MREVEILTELLQDFSKIKKDSLIDGQLWRASYTQEDQKTKKYLSALMREKGFVVRQDVMGNLFGQIKGSQSEETILVGSHLDTVKNGGEFDGLYGFLAGIYAVEELVKEHGKPKYNLAVVGLMEEEGSRFTSGYIGSRAIVGALKNSDFEEVDQSGMTLNEAVKLAGGNPLEYVSAKRTDIKAFYELHIEQGPVLEQEGKLIGLVESINGLRILRITVLGRQDHAGTTPMHMRKDALLHASKIISRMDKWTKSTKVASTATVGELLLKPGSSNVVADFVQFTVDIRSSSAEAISNIVFEITLMAERIKVAGLEVKIDVLTDEAPVCLDQILLRENERICKENGHSYCLMTSGAGHDTQVFAPYIPSALVFVPCIGGRSHTPEEEMTETSMKVGIRLLKQILFSKAW